ncbi:urease accessory protein UreF [Sulfuriferula sp. AH1]|uniref:urease accessory protein UreF n=1 Tax=Sulfuriferula sp. AH1 TaxID=1985873 RepID=UPI000B3B2F6F|nr:urease accessory protein UreF [Sulfuriferula sp. AH1]ARU31407.1 urease accessory protein UreF [Sulfuriferula sp. AH1]
MNLTDLSLLRLLQLASPMLPVGAYSYSQGLEWAVDQRIVHDRDSARVWIGDVLQFNVARFEAPLLLRLYRAWEHDDFVQLAHWNEVFCTSREAAELRAETEQMGYSMRRLMQEMGGFDAARLDQLSRLEPLSFPAAFGCAAVCWNIPPEAMVSAYLWAWVENQVSAAMKSIPVGQVAGQQILAEIAAQLPQLVNAVMVMADDEISNYGPMFAIACSRHETQYSRLFRS